MGWKDTVMKEWADKQKGGYYKSHHLLEICEAQAEISFRAGWQRGWREGIDYSNERFKHKDAFKAGIREVVDFVNEHLPQTLANYVGFWHQWQSQLKEWGLASLQKEQGH